jgi:hypothetical protein
MDLEILNKDTNKTILEALRDAHPAGLTAHDLEKKTGIPRNTIYSQIKELLREYYIMEVDNKKQPKPQGRPSTKKTKNTIARHRGEMIIEDSSGIYDLLSLQGKRVSTIEQKMMHTSPLIALLSSVLTVSVLLAASFQNLVWSFQTEQSIDEFQILGEKAYYKKCIKGPQGKIAEEIINNIDIKLDWKDICKKEITELKNITSSTNTTATTPVTYLIYYDYTNEFSVEYPSDWHVGSSLASIGNDLIIHKGTRDFTLNIYNDSEYSLLDTDSFGSVYFDSYKDMDGVVITDSLARINLGTNDEPALTFSYSKDYYENMVTLLIHNNNGYAFTYKTLKQNSDRDFDTMARFLASIKFLS